jgi:hypothetical protein
VEAAGVEDARAISAGNALEALRRALSADEIVSKLRPALVASEDAAFAWLRDATPVVPIAVPRIPGPDDVPIVVPPHTPQGRSVRIAGGSADEVLERLTEFLSDHKDDQVIVEWRVE